MQYLRLFVLYNDPAIALLSVYMGSMHFVPVYLHPILESQGTIKMVSTWVILFKEVDGT